MMRWIWIIVVIALLTGCVPAGLWPVTPSPTAAGEIVPTLEAVQSETPLPEQQPCAFMWAYESLPEVSKKLVRAFAEANLVVERAYASAFGENCVTADGRVQSFHAMQTDFSLTITLEDIEDKASMGQWVEKILPVLDRFPPGETPGPNPGVVEIHFTSSSGETTLRFTRQKAGELLAQGLHQADLIEALRATY